MRRPRATRIAAAALAASLLPLLCASGALARGGSGSFGFGGGRGFSGGRGLGGAFGRGHFFFIPIGGGGGGFFGFLVVCLIIYVLAKYAWPLYKRWVNERSAAGSARRRTTAKRERRVELAAAEAAEENAAFAPDLVREEAARLFLDIQRAWDAADRIRLRSLVAPELLEEWERRLDDFERRGWHNHVQVLGEPRIEYVGLRNVGEEARDRVTVRVEARLRDFVVDRWGNRIHREDTIGETARVREFWTLGRRGGRWTLVSVEQGAEGSHALEEEIIATPWSNDAALRDESLLEVAAADAVPQGTRIAELADLDYAGGARAAANDLSVADGRFAPAILEVSARRAVAAWVDAIDGDRGALEAIAHPSAVHDLLHPGDPAGRTRLVVRGLAVERIEIAALDAAGEPPAMTIDVSVRGRRYLEDRDTTALLAGSRDRETRFTERWTLVLDGPENQPWRVSGVGITAVSGA